ncbi:MAG: hypothetical protein ABR567_13400 [Myxococcales bacterium]|nr:hypothetical protein [Myxococcales bacterium]
MRNTFGIAVCALLLSSAAFAERSRPAAPAHGFLQDHNLTIGVDTEASIPLGNYSDVNSVGAGAFVNAELALLDTVSATMRLGFEAHVDRAIGTGSSHVNALPILVGGKAWLGNERQGMFGLVEMGLFDLMSSISTGAVSASSNDLKFGMGAGIGYQQNRWNMRVALYTQDVGNFGSAMLITGGIGYSFGAL